VGTCDVFEQAGVADICDNVLEGFHATIFAYGQTGAGKTHTLLGESSDKLELNSTGIIPLSAKYLFEKQVEYRPRITFCEIYNEKVYDLLAPPSSKIGGQRENLKIRSGANGRFYVDGLVERHGESLEELLHQIEMGLQNAMIGGHILNAQSNRSHRLLTIHADTVNDDGQACHGKLNLIDLAGSEDVRTTGSEGQMLKEASTINKSLCNLGKVISSMSNRRKDMPKGQKKALIPYRDSALTKLLADSLGGTAICLILACVSPSAKHLEETKRTLAFACRARSIKNSPVVQMDPQDKLIQDLKAEINSLRRENAMLKETGPETASFGGMSSRGGASAGGGSSLRGGDSLNLGDEDDEDDDVSDRYVPPPQPSMSGAISVAQRKAMAGYTASSEAEISGCLPQPTLGTWSINPDDYSITNTHSPAGSTKAASDYGASLYKDPDNYLAMAGGSGRQPRESPAGRPNMRRPSPAARRARAESAGRSRTKRGTAVRTSKVASASKAARRQPVTKKKNDGPPLSDWAASLVANTGANWANELKSEEPDWAKGLPSLGQGSLGAGTELGHSPRGDAFAFDDWEGKVRSNWQGRHKETVKAVLSSKKKKPDPFSSYGVQPQKKKVDRYTESYEGGGGGWNMSTTMNASMEAAGAGGRGAGVTADQALKQMKRDLMIAQLQAQRNRAEQDRDAVRSMKRY